MTHDDLSALFGVRCDPLPMRDGSTAVDIITPFSFFDGDGLDIFARSAGAHVHLFDDGCTLHWLEGLGLRLSNDRRRWAPIRNAAGAYSVTLTDDGALEVLAPAEAAPAAFARLVSAQLAIDAWARTAVGAPADAEWLIDEAALYLRAWKRSANFIERPDPVPGMSGKTHAFNFAIDDELIDVITAHPTSTGAELRKLIDVRGLHNNEGLEIRVIIDDRAQPAAAEQEVRILSAVASSWTMSRLIAASGMSTATQ